MCMCRCVHRVHYNRHSHGQSWRWRREFLNRQTCTAYQLHVQTPFISAQAHAQVSLTGHGGTIETKVKAGILAAPQNALCLTAGACAGFTTTGTVTGASLAASCWTAGLATLVEKKSRRMELALYCLSRVRLIARAPWHLLAAAVLLPHTAVRTAASKRDLCAERAARV